MGFGFAKKAQSEGATKKRERNQSSRPRPFNGRIHMSQFSSNNPPTSPQYGMGNDVDISISSFQEFDSGWIYSSTTGTTLTVTVASAYWVDMVRVYQTLGTASVNISVNGEQIYRYGSYTFEMGGSFGVQTTILDCYGYGLDLTIVQTTSNNLQVDGINPMTPVTTGGYLVTPNGGTASVSAIRDGGKP